MKNICKKAIRNVQSHKNTPFFAHSRNFRFKKGIFPLHFSKIAPIMSFTIILPIITALILLRIFWLRVKAANAHNENFKKLPSKDQLAVLKECLLNNPSESNLRNLGNFLKKNGLDQDVESYRPFLKKQLELRNKANALEEDNQLFEQEADWLDQITPPEFSEADQERQNGNKEAHICLWLEGINRLYSDKAIQERLSSLIPHYPKAELLARRYTELAELRDNSAADDASLEKIRKAKDAWIQELLNYEP